MNNNRQNAMSRGAPARGWAGAFQERFHGLFFALAFTFTAAVIFGVVT